MSDSPRPERPTRATGAPTLRPALLGRAAAFPPAEARASRTSEEAQRLAWRVLTGAFVCWLALAAIGAVALTSWWQSATVVAPATLELTQGIVLYREREGAAALQARDAMPLLEGDKLELTDNALASLALPGTGRVHLGPGARVNLTALRAGRFNPAVGRIALQHTAGTMRVEVVPDAERLPSVETPYGSARLSPGDYLITILGRQAQVFTRAGEAQISVGAQSERLGPGERIHLVLNGPLESPLKGAPNLVRNGTFDDEFADWQPHDALERTPRFDRGGTRSQVTEVVDGGPLPALRVQRTSLLATHNETGLVQDINAEVAVYPELWLEALVQVRGASLSGGGYLGTEYPMMLRLHYRDMGGHNRTWVQGFFYANPEQRPVDRGRPIARNQWTRYAIDLAQLPQRPLIVYQLEVLGGGHDFDALITDVRLIAR